MSLEKLRKTRLLAMLLWIFLLAFPLFSQADSSHTSNERNHADTAPGICPPGQTRTAGRVLRANFSAQVSRSSRDIQGLARIQIQDFDFDGRKDFIGLPTQQDLAFRVQRGEPPRLESFQIPRQAGDDCNWDQLQYFEDPQGGLIFIAPTRGRKLELGQNVNAPLSVCSARYKEESIEVMTLRLSGEISPFGNTLSRVTTSDGKIYLLLKDKEVHLLEIILGSGTIKSIPMRLPGTSLSLLDVGDFDGDGRLDLLYKDSLGGFLLKSLHSEHSEEIADTGLGPFRPWAYSAQTSKSPPRHVLGDFNGDGMMDLIELRQYPEASTLTYSGSVTGLERNFAHSLQIDAEYKTGDIDGDGDDEIIVITHSSTLAEIWNFHEGGPVAGVSIFLDAETISTSDSSGRFTACRSIEGEQRLRARLSQGRIAKRVVQPWQGKRELILLDDSQPDPDSERVQALGLNGFYQGPSICLGYHVGIANKWREAIWVDCPENHALFGAILETDASPYLARFASNKKSGVMTYGSCCKLPTDDILMKESRIELDDCPKDFIATGLRRVNSLEPPQFGFTCRRVNTQRYQLAPETTGVFWGVSIDMLAQSPRIHKSAIPAAVRESLGRNNRDIWSMKGCVGFPWGSVLVSKGINRCDGFSFRQIQYSGLPGDPKRGTPVNIFPECERVKDPFDPLSGCFNEVTSKSQSQ